MADNRRWTFRMSDKDSVQTETLKMFDKLMASGKYDTDSELFREGVRALYSREFTSTKRAENRRLIEKYSEQTVETMTDRMAGMVREAVSEEMNQIWEHPPDMMIQAFRKMLTDALAEVQIPASEAVGTGSGVPLSNSGGVVPEATGVITDAVGDFLDSL